MQLLSASIKFNLRGKQQPIEWKEKNYVKKKSQGTSKEIVWEK